MTRYLSRESAAVLAGLLVPLAVAAILLPWRASWSNTNVALLLVVAVSVPVLAVAAIVGLLRWCAREAITSPKTASPKTASPERRTQNDVPKDKPRLVLAPRWFPSD